MQSFKQNIFEQTVVEVYFWKKKVQEKVDKIFIQILFGDPPVSSGLTLGMAQCYTVISLEKVAICIMGTIENEYVISQKSFYNSRL